MEGSRKKPRVPAKRKSRRSQVEVDFSNLEVMEDDLVDPDLDYKRLRSVQRRIGGLSITKIHTYVQSMCQVVLHPNSSTQYYYDSIDGALCFDDVLFMVKPLYGAEGESKCPICLDYSRPSVITKCGHVFCWSCILGCIVSNYPRSSCDCPVCQQFVNKKDIKIVIWRRVKPVSVGDVVSMDLYHRKESSSLVECGDHPLTDEGVHMSHDFVQVSKSFWVFDQCQTTECDRMNKKGSVNRFLKFPRKKETALSIIVSCESMLADRKVAMEEDQNLTSIEYKAVLVAIDDASSLMQYVESETSAASTTVAADVTTGASAVALGLGGVDLLPPQRSPSFEKSKTVVHYQMTDGHNVFLHPYNFCQLSHTIRRGRMCEEVGDFVPFLAGNVVNMTRHVISREANRKYKFLSHLPSQSEFTLCLLRIAFPSQLPSPRVDVAIFGPRPPETKNDCGNDDDDGDDEERYIYHNNHRED